MRRQRRQQLADGSHGNLEQMQSKLVSVQKRARWGCTDQAETKRFAERSGGGQAAAAAAACKAGGRAPQQGEHPRPAFLLPASCPL